MTFHRISLGNTVFEGANNAYLHDGDATVLLDTGVAVPDTRQELEAGLTEHGIAFADIDAIVLTHYHADHTGLAGEIQAESGATVYAHEADAPLIAGDAAAWANLEATQRELFDKWGMPDDAREELLAFLEAGEEAGIYGEAVDVTPITDGDTLSVGDLRLEVLHAPGHTAGLCCFVPQRETGTGAAVYTGDALLPQYTPNVGGADVRLEGALAAYVETLETLIDRGYARAWPGHRTPIDEPAERARHILEHHEERAFRVASALEAIGPADAWTVSARLFGDLSDIHILHGPGEAFAHLEHLRDTGAVAIERREHDAIDQHDRAAVDGHPYRLTEAGRTQLAACSDGRWPLSTARDTID
ncbi:MBL fold metallo-hydrolase [Natronosalvus vescus]|uniref:MBL fold metallo-hydrolase n=1 Tax=Natronosalvus vescus TaxID=2953881 RepID=UPI002091A49E|nr:MBL fold metallo-hydrolase [Natronosalvus vescus]